MMEENKVENNIKKNDDKKKKDSFWNSVWITVLTKLSKTYWFQVLIVIALLFSAPHYLNSFFPIPAQANEMWFWTFTSSTPWIYLLILLIRAAVLIFLVWAVVRLITSEE